MRFDCIKYCILTAISHVAEPKREAGSYFQSSQREKSNALANPFKFNEILEDRGPDELTMQLKQSIENISGGDGGARSTSPNLGHSIYFATSCTDYQLQCHQPSKYMNTNQ